MDNNHPSEYRQRIYDKYISEMIHPDGTIYTWQDYQLWADAANVRLRGWLPNAQDTPVLDMGCGAGQFLYLLDQLGFRDLTGVDLSSGTNCPGETMVPKRHNYPG